MMQTEKTGWWHHVHSQCFSYPWELCNVSLTLLNLYLGTPISVRCIIYVRTPIVHKLFIRKHIGPMNKIYTKPINDVWKSVEVIVNRFFCTWYRVQYVWWLPFWSGRSNCVWVETIGVDYSVSVRGRIWFDERTLHL